MSKIVCNIEETVCTPSSNPTVTGSYVRCNIDDPTCIESTPTEGGGAAAPTYTLSGPSSLNESESGIFTVATTGVDEGLLIPYTLTGVQSADVVGGSLTGTFEIDANGAGSVTIQMVEDFVAEGETMVMTIGSALNPLDFINVSIVDPTYTIVNAQGATMVEGNSLNFEIQTTGISIGETRNWDITGSGHSLSATSGTITIQDIGSGLFIGDLVQISSVYDATYQGTSNFTFRVFGSDGVTVVDTLNFTVTDAASTYSQSSATSFDEGTSLAVTVSTTNVQDATTLYWTVNHGTTAAADFTAESGSFTITSNSGSFNVEAVADLTTEGSETFSIELRTGSITGPIVHTSSTITINDTSLASSFSNLNALSVTQTQTAGYVESETISHNYLSDFSMSFWVKFAGNLNQSYTNAFYFGARQGTSRDWASRFVGLQLQYRGNGFNYIDIGGAYAQFSEPAIDDGDWHHVVVTYDSSGVTSTDTFSGTDVTNKFTIYFDGIAATYGSTSGTSSFNASSALTNFRVGDFMSSYTEPSFDVDEFAYWTSTKLTSTEVGLLYNNGITDLENTSNVTVPTRYWRYEDNNNLNKDTISDSNQGTVDNATQTTLTSSDSIYVP
jgi:hypothetical protein